MRCTYITLLPGVGRYVLPFRSVRRHARRALLNESSRIRLLGYS